MNNVKEWISVLAISLLVVFSVLGACGLAFAQERFPSKPITCVVGWGAGGGNDLVARAMSVSVEKILGKPMVIVNRPGAGAEIGFTEIQRATPTGYTIGMVSTPTLVLNTLERATSYQLNDFTYIIGLAEDPRTIAVAADSRWKTIHDVITYAKANPGKFRIGHGGVGTHAQYASLDFAFETGIEITDVPFQGSASSIAAVLGGHVEAACPAVGEVKKNVEAGQMRILVIFSDQRSPDAPNVPTGKELGIQGLHVSVRGLAGPKGIAADRIKILHDAFKKGMESPEYVKKMKDLAITNRYMTGEEYVKLVQEHVTMYRPLVEKIKSGKSK